MLPLVNDDETEIAMVTNERQLTTAEVLDRVPVSKTELYRMINSGEFPKPKPFGACRVVFLELEIDAWTGRRHVRSNQGFFNKLKSIFRNWFGARKAQ